MTFGICTPYGRDEATWMAFSLAATLKNLSEVVEFLPLQRNDPGLHYHWDKQVASGKRWKNFSNWAKRVRQLVWFDLNPEKLRQAKRLGIRNTYVAMWQRLQLRDLAAMEEFDLVVFPSQAVERQFSDCLRRVRTRTIPWDASLAFEERKPFYQDGCKRVLVPISGSSARYATPALLATIRVLVDRDPDVRFTLMPMRTFPKILEPQVNDLITSREQVKLLRKPTYRDRVVAMREHDWLLSVSLHANSAIDVAEALAVGTPVIAFDLPPFNEVVRDGVNGRLIPCDLRFNELKAPRAIPNADRLLEVLSICLAGTRERTRLAETSRSLVAWMEDRRRVFQQGWRSLWEEHAG